MAIFPLTPRVQRYDWGSRHQIPELFHLDNPTDAPIAELWMGAHPSAPSFLARRAPVDAGAAAAIPQGARSLGELISEDPQHAVGEEVRARWGNRLPFLLKVLSAERPLSIQAHPSLEQAKRGFEDEEGRGVPIGAPERRYKDENHKPELLCAVTEFWVLRGFRPRTEIKEEFCDGGWPLAAELVGRLRSDAPDEEAIPPLMEAFLKATDTEREELVRFAVSRAEQMRREPAANGDTDAYAAPRYFWVAELARQFPGDIGILAPLYLNCFSLAPGEATYLDAGTLHAYLHGTGIEIMANSDNVLRGGLTSKLVDVPELLKVVRFESERPEPLRAHDAAPSPGVVHEQLYSTPAAEFELRRITADRAEGTLADVAGPQILFCAAGDFEITELTGEPVAGGDSPAAEGPTLTITRGESAFVTADAGSLRLRGRGVLYRALCAQGGLEA